MPLIINTNVSSLNAQRLLGANTFSLQKNYERLASGYRINKASDDAAGLQISEKLRSQIRGISQALNNAQDGISLLSIAEGTLTVVNDHLQRIRELTVQAANDTNSSDQRTAIDNEIKARLSDVNRITKATQFNGKSLLTGNPSTASIRLHVGANAVTSLDTINVALSALGSATATTLGISGTGASVGATASSARTFLGKVDSALTTVANRLAKIGSIQSRLESAITNLSIQRENFTASESRIRDLDVASESALLAKNQILQQASASILSQANQSPQLALTLLQTR